MHSQARMRTLSSFIVFFVLGFVGEYSHEDQVTARDVVCRKIAYARDRYVVSCQLSCAHTRPVELHTKCINSIPGRPCRGLRALATMGMPTHDGSPSLTFQVSLESVRATTPAMSPAIDRNGWKHLPQRDFTAPESVASNGCPVLYHTFASVHWVKLKGAKHSRI